MIRYININYTWHFQLFFFTHFDQTPIITSKQLNMKLASAYIISRING